MCAIVAIAGTVVALVIAKSASDSKSSERLASEQAETVAGATLTATGKRASAPHGPGGPGGQGGPGAGGAPNFGNSNVDSFERAKDTNNIDYTKNPNEGPELSDNDLIGPLSACPCPMPSDVSARVSVAVQNGHAVGVTASTSPNSPGVNACLQGWAGSRRWPVSSRRKFVSMRY